MRLMRKYSTPSPACGLRFTHKSTIISAQVWHHAPARHCEERRSNVAAKPRNCVAATWQSRIVTSSEASILNGYKKSEKATEKQNRRLGRQTQQRWVSLRSTQPTPLHNYLINEKGGKS